ncbi:hypothetical protein M9435_003316 [Picochlorum sp. BPE23]|nr:hypothetical protein M9435_003316 [Picochlorum sp. BPE23]
MDEEPFRAPEIYSTANQREEPRHTRYLNHKEQQEVDSSEITLGRELGQGSYGIVYQGTWHGVVIAVKRIRPPQGTSWSSVDRELLVRVFKEQVQPEVHIMSTVRHPFVVGCYGCCVDPPSILLELCPRGSLGHMLQKCHEERALRDLMSWRQRLCMLRQVASAMRFLHSKNVLHRDLRAMNVVIAQDMTAKVSDVGLGKFVDEVSSRSAGTLGRGGNPRWLAPELVSENQPFTRACDVYGFGTIIWEMMEWRLPWEGMSEVHIIRDILQGRSLKVAGKSRWGSLPGPAPHHSRTLAQLSSLASKCMHSKPSARPSFADIVQTLLRLEEKEPQGQPLRQQHDDASSNALNRPPVCCICIDVDANTIISGCGHLCLCQGCSQTGQVTCCPICRAPGLPQRIYFA